MIQRRSVRAIGALIIAGVGIWLSLLSLFHYVGLRNAMEQGPSFCNINAQFNCDLVASSAWSVFLGLPLASWGLFFYLTVTILLLTALTSRRFRDAGGYSVIYVLAAIASFSSVFLFAISEFVIGSLCLICLAMYGVNFALFLFAMWLTPERVERGLQPAFRAIWSLFRGSISGATALTMILFAGVTAARSEAIVLEIRREINAAQHEDIEKQIAKMVDGWRAQPVQTIPVLRDDLINGDYVIGSPGAPVQVVEFVDFECPHCGILFLAVHELMDDHPGQLEVIFRNYPLDQSCNSGMQAPMHQVACLAAEYVRCAGEQNRFWEAAELIFNLESIRGKTPSFFESEMARESVVLSLDPQGLKECRDSDRQMKRIREDVAQGDAFKIPGTPAVWVNGKRVLRPFPEVMDAIVASILEKKQ